MEDNTAQSHGKSARKAGLIGGAIGSIGLAATLLAVTATAGAAEPTFEAQPSNAIDVHVDESDADFPTDEDWADYDACVNAAFEAAGIDFETEGFDADGENLEDLDFMDFGPSVSIMDGDDLSFADFGEGDGSITITKNGDEVSISSDGDVTVETLDFEDAVADFGDEFPEGELEMSDIDNEAFAAIDDALAGCDDKLPEGIDFDSIADAEVLDEDDLEELDNTIETVPADVN